MNLLVGDTYTDDILGARAVGIYPVLLKRKPAPDDDCMRIDRLSELLPLFT